MCIRIIEIRTIKEAFYHNIKRWIIALQASSMFRYNSPGNKLNDRLVHSRNKILWLIIFHTICSMKINSYIIITNISQIPSLDPFHHVLQWPGWKKLTSNWELITIVIAGLGRLELVLRSTPQVLVSVSGTIPIIAHSRTAIAITMLSFYM